MKRLFKWLLGLVLLLVLLVVGFALALDPIVEKAVSAGLTDATGSESKLASADVGLMGGNLALGGLTVQNPPGFRDQPVLELNEIAANWRTASLFSSEVHVGEVDLDGLVLNLELDGKETNLGPIIAELRKRAAESEEPTDGDTPEGEGKKVHIDRITVSGVRANLHISGVPAIAGDYSAEVPRFTIEDLGNGENSATLAEWSARILEVLLVEARRAGQGTFPAEWQSLLDGDLDALKDDALEEIQGQAEDWLEKQKGELPGEVGDGLDELEKQGKGLKDLFGGGKDGE